MKLLNKSAILAACALQYKDVEIKGVGTIRISTMTGAEREAWRATLVSKDGKNIGAYEFGPSIIVATAIDEAGNKLFTATDIEAIKNAPAGRFEGAFLAAYHLNGLGGDAIEDAVKNSASGQSDDSGSDSLKS